MSKRLLIETRMAALSLCESAGKGKTHPGCLGTLSGPCADYANPTRNGNFYSRKLWENVFADPIVKESLEDRILIGELDHPGDRLETKATNACIVMTGYQFNDDESLVYGTFDILDTPNGRILKSLLDAGCKIGVSSRGEGDVETKDISSWGETDCVVEDAYNFVGFDAVVLPAVKVAKPTLQESFKYTSLKESLKKEVESATTAAELSLIRKVVEATDMPDSGSLLESIDTKTRGLNEGATSSSTLLEDLEKATSQIQDLVKENGSLKEELATSQTRVRKLINSRVSVMERVRRQKQSYDELHSKYESSVTESASLSHKVERLEEGLTESAETIKTLRGRIGILSSDKSKLESKVSHLEESLLKSQESVREKLGTIRQLKSKLESLKKSTEGQITESKRQGAKLKESLEKSGLSLKESHSKYGSLLESYAREKARTAGVPADAILEGLKKDSTAQDVDTLIESYVGRSDRYRSLPITHDALIGSLDGSVTFSGKSCPEDAESKQSLDFMREALNLH